MSTEINKAVQAIGEGCVGHLGFVPELLGAAVPEFLGGLGVALVTALAAWGLRRRRALRTVPVTTPKHAPHLDDRPPLEALGDEPRQP